MKKNLRAIDCFCGAGGLSVGFEKAGFDVFYAFDFDENAIATYKNNPKYHKGKAFVRDIYKVSKKSIEKDLGGPLGTVDVVIGGPPCQGFSIQRRGADNDPRNQLVLEYARLIKEIQPRFFVMENVSGILSKRGKPYLDALRSELESAGYIIHMQKLTATDYGVPQLRKRVVIVGEKLSNKKAKFQFPTPTCLTAMTVRDAIFDLMNTPFESLPNHKADMLSQINLRRIRSLKAGEGRDSLPEELQLACHKNNKGHRHLDAYGRMSWDEPSPTITAHFDSFSRGRFGHPVQDRTITLREGARMQTFPDDFVFIGNKVQVARQIGNAVPPRLAEAVAKKVKECLR